MKFLILVVLMFSVQGFSQVSATQVMGEAKAAEMKARAESKKAEMEARKAKQEAHKAEVKAKQEARKAEMKAQADARKAQKEEAEARRKACTDKTKELMAKREVEMGFADERMKKARLSGDKNATKVNIQEKQEIRKRYEVLKKEISECQPVKK